MSIDVILNYMLSGRVVARLESISAIGDLPNYADYRVGDKVLVDSGITGDREIYVNYGYAWRRMFASGPMESIGTLKYRIIDVLGTHTDKADLPYDSQFYVAAGASTAGDIYLTHLGYLDDEKKETYKYDPIADTFTDLATPSSYRRWYVTCEVVSDVLYVMGGMDVGYHPEKWHESFDIATRTWAAKADLPSENTTMASYVESGKIRTIGGFDPYMGTSFNYHWEYDPITNTWDDTTLTALPEAKSAFGAANIGGKVYCPGGYNSDMDPTQKIYIYDIAGNSWDEQLVTNYPYLADYAMGVVSNEIYIFGGSNLSETYTDKCYKLDPSNFSYIEIAPLDTPKSNMTAVTIGTKIYLFGGTSASASYGLKDTVVYGTTPEDKTAPIHGFVRWHDDTAEPVVKGTAYTPPELGKSVWVGEE